MDAFDAAPKHGHPRTTYLVKRLELAVRAHLDQVVGEIGLTTPQYAALSALPLKPGTTSAELARLSFVSPQAMNEMVGVLERKGLIRRQASPENKKRLGIFLTEHGKECLRQCEKRADQVEEILFAALSVAEHQTLDRLLRKCTDTLTKDSTTRQGA